MDITIKCQLSLSKKLRALIQEGETRIVLVAPNITDGRGEANLVISSDKNLNRGEDLLGKETSIMLVPIEMVDVSIDPTTVGTIFTKNARIDSTATVRSSVEKMAVMEIEAEKAAHSIKRQAEIAEELPQAFEITQKPEFRNYIETLEALDEAIDAAKTKTSGIDPDSIQDPRKRAEAKEIKEKLEAIDVDAYIVNDKCANLSINDLGINLVLNAPYNLSNISARRLLGSRELKAMFKAKLVKFIRPEEIPLYTKKAAMSVEDRSIDVYSSPEEAEEHMERSGMNVEKLNLSVDSLYAPTENEMLLTNLTAAPTNFTANGGVTRTVHGNTTRTPKTVSDEAKQNSKGLKSIRRTGLSY